MTRAVIKRTRGAVPQSNVIFFDDFPGNTLDSSKWDGPYNRLSDQANGELCGMVPECVRVDNGLFIDSKHEDVTIGDSIEAPKLMNYKSGQISGKLLWKYGTLEARVRMPGGIGLWPLVWLLGEGWQESQPFTANTPEHNWPVGIWSEIDVAEHLDNTRTENNCVVHFGEHGGSFPAELPFASNSRFMVWRLQWSANALIWSVDAEDGQGFRTLRTITDPSKIPNVRMYVVLSVAVGGIGGGDPDPGTFPQTYQAAWVRITQ